MGLQRLLCQPDEKVLPMPGHVGNDAGLFAAIGTIPQRSAAKDNQNGKTAA
ncbi:MAG: hypothetical protein ACLQPD_14115 [Desulfomonilaceae bacterium]